MFSVDSNRDREYTRNFLEFSGSYSGSTIRIMMRMLPRSDGLSRQIHLLSKSAGLSVHSEFRKFVFFSMDYVSCIGTVDRQTFSASWWIFMPNLVSQRQMVYDKLCSSSNGRQKRTYLSLTNETVNRRD